MRSDPIWVMACSAGPTQQKFGRSQMIVGTLLLTDGPSLARLLGSYQHRELNASFTNNDGYVYQVRITGLTQDGAAKEAHNFIGVIRNPKLSLIEGHYVEGWFYAGSPRYGFMNMSDQAIPMHSEEGISVSSMYKNCSLQIQNFGRPGVAASDNCGDQSNSAVFQPWNSAWYYRCPKHEGLLELKKHGRSARSIHISPR